MKIRCKPCGSVLQIDDSSAGQIIQCPACQHRMRAPAQRHAATASRMSGASVSSPRSSTSRPESTRSGSPRSGPAQRTTATASRSSATAPVANPAPPQSQPPASGGDDVFSDPGPQHDPLAPSAPLGAPAFNQPRRTQGFPSVLATVGDWSLRNVWATLVIAACVFNLLVCLFHGSHFLVLGVIEAVVGLVVIGALQIPRIYLMKRLVNGVGAAFSAIATGVAGMSGFALLLLFLNAGRRIVRASNKASDKGIDLSGGDASVLMTLLGGFAVLLIIVAVAAALWYWIGIARVIASAYLAHAALLMLPIALSTSSHDRFSAARAEHRQRQETWEPPVDRHPIGGRAEGNRPSPQLLRPESEGGFGPERPALAHGHQQAPQPSRAPSEPAPVQTQPATVQTQPATVQTQPATVQTQEVKVILLHRPDMDVPATRAALVRAAGSGRWRAKREPGRATFIIDYPGTVDEFVQLIDFGTVTDSDADSRQITVDAR